MFTQWKRILDSLKGVKIDLEEIVQKKPRNNREFVCELVKYFGAKRVAEVGVWKGQLSRMLLTRCQLDYLLMIDPLEMQRNLFQSRSQGPHPSMMQDGIYNCRMGEETLTQEQLDELHRHLVNSFQRDFPGKSEFIRLPSVEASKKVPDGSLDLIFIDAIHLYEDVLEDIAAWLPKLKPDGILAGDDYTPAFQGVIDAVNETFTEKIRRVYLPSAVWYVRKRDVPRGKNLPGALKRIRKAS